MGRRKTSSTRGGIKNGGKIRKSGKRKNERQMLKSIIRALLKKFIDDIDSGNCNMTTEQQSKIISVLSNIANPDQRMSKIQACDYLGVSRATFDNYVRDGFIPKGIKQEGFKELSWHKVDLDLYLASKE